MVAETGGMNKKNGMERVELSVLTVLVASGSYLLDLSVRPCVT